MTTRLCNRCGETYRAHHGGKIVLTRGSVEVTAKVCSDCYDAVLEAYTDD